MKTPKTIADLDIVWTFHESYATRENFSKLNPSIKELKVKPNEYTFVFNDSEFRCASYNYERLSTFFVFLNQSFWCSFRKEIKLDKFERISDTKYIIHGK